MKMKTLFLSSGIFALIVAVSPIIPRFTQAALADTTQNAQGTGTNKLNLSNAQKEKLKKIQDSANQKMDKVFTSNQKSQIQAARQQNQKPNLTLSNEQKEKIKSIYQETKAKVDAVLTPAQKKQLQEMQSSTNQKN